MRLLKKQPHGFDLDTIKVIAGAYESACAALGVIDCNEPMAERIAEKLIEAAQTGERNPFRLFQTAVDSTGAAITPSPYR
jgi:hypothetical protein